MENKFLVTDYGVTPDCEDFQTEKLQAVFDLCKENGGTVIFPKGKFVTKSLQMWSDTTLYLESGAYILGSDICEDYALFPIPEGMEMRTDMEMIPQHYKDRPWKEYRRALISVYGGKNIKIIGEEGSCIDGNDCCDPGGEEGFRGPHGILITNVENVTLEGYQIQHCGNFHHQLDVCKNVTMKNVTCIAGHDGIHLHHCEDILIEDCVFHTGDDCVAGINMKNLTVRRCDINTSCHPFRAGGEYILVEDCHIWGPGIYPHRKTIVQNRYTDLVRDKANTLPHTEGRHNIIATFIHFASINHPNPVPFHDVVFRNCKIENVTRFLKYTPDVNHLQTGTYLSDFTLENVTFSGVAEPSMVTANDKVPLTVTLKNVTLTPTEEMPNTQLFDGQDPNTTVVVCN